MGEEFVDVLKRLIADRGLGILDDAKICHNLLLDYGKNTHKREINLFARALERKFCEKLRNSNNRDLDKRQMAKYWHEDEGVDIVVAENILSCLCHILFNESLNLISLSFVVSNVQVNSQPSTGSVFSEAVSAVPSVNSLMKRGYLFLEDLDWKQANEYFNKVLDIDPEYAPAYIGLLCMELEIKSEADLTNHKQMLDNMLNYQKALRFADTNYRTKIVEYNQAIKKLITEKKRLEQEYIAKQEKERIAREEQQKLKLMLQAQELRKEQIQKLKKIRENYLKFNSCITAGHGYTIGLKANGTVIAVGGMCDVGKWHDIVAVATGYNRTVGLKANGTVVTAGINSDDQYKDTNDWQDIIAIATGYEHIVGLKADGTVVAVGENDEGQCNTSDWQNIIAIAAGYNHTVGLKANGTVVAVGRNEEYNRELKKNVCVGQCNTSDWYDIIAVTAGYINTIGLKADGTVVVAGKNDNGQCNTSDWQDIVAVSSSSFEDTTEAFGGILAPFYGKWSHTVGLKADGTVVVAGKNDNGQCNTSDWRNVIAISAGSNHTVGLKADGTVVAVGKNDGGQCNVNSWRNIVAITTGDNHTVGLKADGTVVAVGNNGYGGCNTNDWLNIGIVDKEQLQQEKKSREKRIPELKKSRENNIKYYNCICVGDDITVGLIMDGTVVAAGKNDDGKYKISGWRDIIAVSANWSHIVGLKVDGSVVIAERQSNRTREKLEKKLYEGLEHMPYNKPEPIPEFNISSWYNIVAIAAGNGVTGDSFIVGLKVDGTVIVEIGKNDNGQSKTSDWQNIIAIATGRCYTIGLKADGTVVAVGRNYDGQCNTSEWQNIVAITAGDSHTVGLKADGTVIAVGKNDKGQCNTSEWRDIVAIAACNNHTIGLKVDGTVIVIGDKIENEKDGKHRLLQKLYSAMSGRRIREYYQCHTYVLDRDIWHGIVSIHAGGKNIVGLKSNGTVVTIGKNYDDQYNINDWRNIGSPSKEQLIRMQQGLCLHCGGQMGGLFIKKCKSCGLTGLTMNTFFSS